MQNNTSTHYFSLPELQSLLGVKSRKTILKYIRSGKLAAYKIGGTRWRIAREDVETFMGSHKIDETVIHTSGVKK